MKRHYSMAALRMVALGAAVVLSLAGIARAADFITGYAWRTLTVNSDLAEPSTLAQSNCHLKSDGTTEPCTTANADLTFTTDGFNFHTTPGEQASSQTFRQFLDTNLSSFTVNNKS